MDTRVGSGRSGARVGRARGSARADHAHVPRLPRRRPVAVPEHGHARDGARGQERGVPVGEFSDVLGSRHSAGGWRHDPRRRLRRFGFRGCRYHGGRRGAGDARGAPEAPRGARRRRRDHPRRHRGGIGGPQRQPRGEGGEGGGGGCEERGWSQGGRERRATTPRPRTRRSRSGHHGHAPEGAVGVARSPRRDSRAEQADPGPKKAEGGALLHPDDVQPRRPEQGGGVRRGRGDRRRRRRRRERYKVEDPHRSRRRRRRRGGRLGSSRPRGGEKGGGHRGGQVGRGQEQDQGQGGGGEA
mmetsp:Transcript_3957/g.14726  ORF Transcript_3957/g.14726 Transcript_3957/m.14726 type:complete len:299 (+) Transcript_3957:2177-3073(+)